MNGFDPVSKYFSSFSSFGFSEEDYFTPEFTRKRSSETAFGTFTASLDDSFEKKARLRDPYTVCALIIDQLAQNGDTIGDFFYGECLQAIPNIVIDGNTVFGCDQLKTLFTREEVEEILNLLEWYHLLCYGEVINDNKVTRGLLDIKCFLGIGALTDMLISPQSASHSEFQMRFDNFLEKLTTSDNKDRSVLFNNLSGLIRIEVEEMSQTDNIISNLTNNFNICDVSLTNDCSQYLGNLTFHFRARFVFLTGLLSSLISDKEGDNVACELDKSLQIFPYPLQGIFVSIRNFALQSAFNLKVAELFSFPKFEPMMRFPSFAKLNLPGHPNWMPNGGNSCYISSTLWPLFLLLNSEVKEKIEEFQRTAINEEAKNLLHPGVSKAREAFIALYGKIAKETVENIEVKDVNALRSAVQNILPDQFIPNTYTPEDACDFLIWLVNDLLEFSAATTKAPKFSVLHTFCRTTEDPLLEDAHYDYNAALLPSYSNQPSYILDLRLDDGNKERKQLFELVTISRNTEIIERNAYNMGTIEGPKYHTFPTHHHECIVVESKESAPKFFVGRVTRFALDNVGTKIKRFDPICPNATLDFKIKGREEADEAVSYDLVAMTVHKGNTIENGHYYCYFRKEVEGALKFYKYDDITGPSFCEEIEVMEDVTKNGYLFYYRKREEGALPPTRLQVEETFNDLPKIPENEVKEAVDGAGVAFQEEVNSVAADNTEMMDAKLWVAKKLPGQYFIEENGSTLPDLEGDEELEELAAAFMRPVYVLDPLRDQDLFFIENQIPIPGEKFQFGVQFTGEVCFLFRLPSGAFLIVQKN